MFKQIVDLTADIEKTLSEKNYVQKTNEELKKQINVTAKKFKDKSSENTLLKKSIKTLNDEKSELLNDKNKSNKKRKSKEKDSQSKN